MDKNELLKELEKRGVDIQSTPTLRSFLTQTDDIYMEQGYIGFLPDPKVTSDITDEVLDMSSKLDDYIHENWEDVGIDFHHYSEKGCYFLSTLFTLSTDWTLVQGIFTLPEKDHVYYHSWVEKDGVVYDPAFKVVTTKEKYQLFFDEKHRHTKEDTKNLYRRTAMFTYYVEDLEAGIVSPLAYATLYDTEEASKQAEKVLTKLEQFLDTKQK